MRRSAPKTGSEGWTSPAASPGEAKEPDRAEEAGAWFRSQEQTNIVGPDRFDSGSAVLDALDQDLQLADIGEE